MLIDTAPQAAITLDNVHFATHAALSTVLVTAMERLLDDSRLSDADVDHLAGIGQAVTASLA